MLFLDGVYIGGSNGLPVRFRRVKTPTRNELTKLMYTIAHRVARCLERQGLLEHDTGNIYLTPEAVKAEDKDPSNQLLGSSITYRIAVGSQQGRKVFTLQTLPDCESDNPFASTLGEVAGFSLHAGVATRANERAKLERLCRYITRPAVSTNRLSMTRNGQVRYELKPFCYQNAGHHPCPNYSKDIKSIHAIFCCCWSCGRAICEPAAGSSPPTHGIWEFRSYGK